jgi:hypothetical protein
LPTLEDLDRSGLEDDFVDLGESARPGGFGHVFMMPVVHLSATQRTPI